MHRHFSSCRNFNRQKIWHQKHERKIVQSRPDFFLYTDWQSLRKYSTCNPCHFVTDHNLICGVLMSNTLKKNMQYFWGRTRFPHRTPKMGPSSKMDSLCHDIKMKALPPVTTTWTHKWWISNASWRFVDQLNALRRLDKTLRKLQMTI